MKTTFLDKNGTPIKTGDIIRFKKEIRIGTRVYRRGRKRETFGTYKNMELTGIIRFGRFDLHGESIMTFFVETGE